MATAGTGQISPNIEDNHHNYHRTRVANLTKLIGVELDLLKESFEEAKRRIDPVIEQINLACHDFDKILGQAGVGETNEMERELRDLKQTTGKLKSKIPFNLIAPEYQPAADPNVIFQPRTHLHKSTTLVVHDELVDNNPPIPQYLDLYFRYHSSYRSTVLLCFLAFPEGAFIKASLLWSYVNATLYALPDEKRASLENTVSIASDLVSEGFIKSVYKKHSSTAIYGFWMDPLVHHTLHGHLSKEAHRPTELTSIVTSRIDGEDIFYGGSADPSTWPSELNFLHLGKWQRSPIHHHIEMPEPNLYFKHTGPFHPNWYFENIGPFHSLAYISFRGVSVMKELPSFITHLWELRILDLKSCHHLEVLPSDIGNLWRSLTHLDMSECYFLDHMPASISQLTRLRVLKGFIVGETNNEESCNLEDLSSTKYLVKLNIYTSLKTFPSEDHLTILQGFFCLRNLTICWGGCPARDENLEFRRPTMKSPAIRLKRLVTHISDPVVRFNKKFRFDLQKLDLRGAPENGTGNWLTPWNFERLEKLYIRGGKLNDLKNIKEAQKGKRLKQYGWSSVKILCLRHLSKLRLDWSDLRSSFPNVVCVEKVDCPNLTSFPCDDSGLWTANATQPRTYNEVKILEKTAE